VSKILEPLLRAECRRLESYELNGMRRTGNVVFLSQEEAIYAGGRCEGLRFTDIPPVFDYEPAARPSRKPGTTVEVGFLGDLTWWPNQLSLRWFAQKVLPHVNLSIRLNLFGRPSGHSGRRDPRIVEHGIVEKIEQVWDTCDFMICPAAPTGGVCVKFAEAAYNRVPVLATTHAARGLPLGDDGALVFLNEPAEWIEYLNSASARELAEKQVLQKTCAGLTINGQLKKFQDFARNVVDSGVMPGDAVVTRAAVD
jgi:hypothetical protein